MIDRMMRAARLDVNLYEEVEHDESLTTQALQVVVLVSVLSAIGRVLGLLFAGNIGAIVGGLLFGVLQTILAWGSWSYVTYLVGTKMFNGNATYGQLLRTVGYAYSPGALAVFGFIPVLGGILGAVGGIWTLVAGAVAVRQALDITTEKAIATILVSIIPTFIVLIILNIPLALLGA